jgi:hypothetical protein
MVLADNFRSFAEHSQTEGDSIADRHRLIAYTSNPLERMLVAPMNMNFHTAHHLWRIGAAATFRGTGICSRPRQWQNCSKIME